MIRDRFKNRNYIIRGAVALVVLIFIARLFVLQVVKNYADIAESNAFYKETIYASRGMLYDRNGKLLVYNHPTYDVMVIMRDLNDQNRRGTPIDTLELCELLSISRVEFDTRMENIKDRSKNRGYSPLTPQRFITQLTPTEYAVFQEKLRKFPGFSIQVRTLRKFAYPIATHALGSIGEVSKNDIENDPFYKQGDYIGINGVEKQYEHLLRGENGMHIKLRDSRGRIQGQYKDGDFDVDPIAGKNLTLTLDLDLQQYAEQLMQNKIGSIVAIEPSTGEILALVSAPSYDPSLLIGRQRSENYEKLRKDPNKPLLDRPLMARYPPGSTFKCINALIFEQEGIISENTRYNCNHGYVVGNFRLGCHAHVSPLDLPNSISNSCNAYYCAALRDMLDHKKYGNIRDAFDVWKHHVVAFGFGYRTGVDLPNENRGFIPNTEVYDKIHGKNRWRSLNIVSISIGQGEIISTPLQLANSAAIIANKGWWIRPHILKGIEGEKIDTFYTNKHYTMVESRHFEPVIQGMEWAVNGGPTGSTARSARVEDIIVCGKTGTAENPHGADHSIFFCFAPKDNPKIAVAIIVDNAGFGGTWAAPMASLVVEKYLKGEIPENRSHVEERILNANFMPHAK